MRKAPPRIDPGTRGAIYPKRRRPRERVYVVNKIIFRMPTGHSLVHATTQQRLSFYELQRVYNAKIIAASAAAYSCFSALMGI